MSKSVRSDEVLYSGMNSQSFVKQKEIKAEKKDEKSSKRAALQPYQEIIDAEIAKLRQEIASELGNLITVDTDKEDVKSIVLGLRLADDKLARLKGRLDNLLRVQTLKEEDGSNL